MNRRIFRRPRLPSGGRAFLLAGLLLLSACEQQASAPPPDSASSTEQSSVAGTSVPLGEGFDFYVLSLSWSPSYCEAEREEANRQQCSAGRPYAFVVHGLWPQFERGYPENCGGEREVDRETLRGLYDIMPSAGLIRHQWRKHGTCSGLPQDEYFDVLRQARERVVIPPEFRHIEAYKVVAPDAVEASFLQANRGLAPQDIAVSCDKHFLREVRICMTKRLEFRACPEIDRRACRADKVVMPPVRGG